MPRRRVLTEAQLETLLALAHAIGIRFAPRIPNLAERRLYAFEAASTWPVLAPFIAGRPDEKAIIAH